ncbi:snRNA-activating protein complex subunit 3 [Cylas formicarius]|uniref:snRNA-activating protein complex subunit 3 n=1 Tax=Cylas formicarius TaxID=197179 RepID=UPI0029586EE4|nr:snRNA-activating protein complex subunit 3 [Cylas formicarius]
MEKVYATAAATSTDPINIQNYFQEYKAICPLSNSNVEGAEEIKDLLGNEFDLDLSKEKIASLEELCSIHKLKLCSEPKDLPLDNMPQKNYIPVTYPITKEAKILETVKCKEGFNVLKNNFLLDFTTRPNKSNVNNKMITTPQDIDPGSTFIYNILVYQPFSTMTGQKLSIENLRIMYEIEAIGLNTLLDIANAIKCISDLFCFKEVENTEADLSKLVNAKEIYPSRCFFIENVFYNDPPHGNASVYSSVVIKWAKEKHIGDFHDETMDTPLNNLKPRLGFGYVYIHQGNCEHIITFSDARMIQNNDSLISSEYPKIISAKQHANHLCFICQYSHSSWMVMDSDRLPIRNAFFCTKCCKSYMFVNGKKLGSFRLYPYYDSEVLARYSVEDEIK